MEEFKLAAAIIGQLGVPTFIVVWYFFIERPNQRKREESLESRFDTKLEKMIVDERKVCDLRRSEDKQHALELAKLGGEIHLTATRELKEAINGNSAAVERLEARHEKAIEEITDCTVAVQQAVEEIRKKKN